MKSYLKNGYIKKTMIFKEENIAKVKQFAVAQKIDDTEALNLLLEAGNIWYRENIEKGKKINVMVEEMRKNGK